MPHLSEALVLEIILITAIVAVTWLACSWLWVKLVIEPAARRKQ